jgi:pilus assembly protein CpaF
MRAVRQQLSSALDLVVHIGRMPDGSRRVTTISEVQRMESDVIAMQDLFELREDGSGDLTLSATGLRPTFLHKFERHGVSLPAAGTRAPAVTQAPEQVFTRGGRR